MLIKGEIKEHKQMAMNVSPYKALRLQFSHFFILTCIAMILISVSCATKKMKNPIDSQVERQNTAYSDANLIETRLLNEYKRWQGTHHKMGGTDSKGIDCSGFVKEVYREVFNINLPRTTRMQVKLGRPVAINDLQPGDLVFFKPPTYARHIGIYLNQSEFVHASKNKGVTISRIDAHYWGKYYWTARRILPAHETR